MMSREHILTDIRQIENEIKQTRDEIRERGASLSKLRKELTQLKTEMEKVKKKPPVVLWKPEDGDYYYFQNTYGFIKSGISGIWNNNYADNDISVHQKVFPIKKLAELKRDINLATEEYKRKVAEFNGDWEADWDDLEQDKCNLTNSIFPTVSQSETYYNPLLEGCYFSTQVRENKEQFEELKKLYRKIIDLTEEYKKAEKEWRNAR